MTKPNHFFFLFASSLILLFSTSCGQSVQTESDAITDTLIVEEPKVIPISEISIKGKWVSKDNSLYGNIEFKGKSTVLFNTVFVPFVTSYERDEEFIRVKTDKSDLLFELVSEDSIVGYGFAKGHWIRQK